MGVPVLILGPSGSGKTYAMRNIPKNKYGLIECEKTVLSFPGGKKFARTKDYERLRDIIGQYAERYPIVVVDDFGYCATNLYIEHIADKDQFWVYKAIASETYRTIEFINDLPGEVVVYITMHVDSDALGNITPKIMGKMVNEKIDLMGCVGFCILCEMVDGEHAFIVEGKPPAKTNHIFDEPVQTNDLAPVDERIREYMGWCGVDA